MIAQEPYLMSTELGHTIDEVENLIKKHEAFEKSAAAQEERFSALERLTTFELKEMKRRQEAAEKAEQDRIRAEEEAKAALEAQAEEARRADRSGDQHDAPGSPQREKESGKNQKKLFFLPQFAFPHSHCFMKMRLFQHLPLYRHIKLKQMKRLNPNFRPSKKS